MGVLSAAITDEYAALGPYPVARFAQRCWHVSTWSPLTFHDAAKRPPEQLPCGATMSKTDDKALVQAAAAESGGGGVSLGKVGLSSARVQPEL